MFCISNAGALSAELLLYSRFPQSAEAQALVSVVLAYTEGRFGWCPAASHLGGAWDNLLVVPEARELCSWLVRARRRGWGGDVAERGGRGDAGAAMRAHAGEGGAGVDGGRERHGGGPTGRRRDSRARQHGT
jgi:hypothetical protein